MLSQLVDFNMHLPVTDPTWIFFIVLGIILFAPILFGYLKVPHIIGMILAGVVIGENGLNVIARDSSFELFGNVGLYYIMFLAGLEMNMSDFKSIRGKAIVFGLLGFAIPMALGCMVNSMVLQYAAIPSMLIASMYASHTLVSYPIVSRYGVSRQRSVSVAVGATAITDSLTLFLLAIIGGLYKGSGEGNWDWLWLVVKVAALSALVIYFFPRLGRWFFRRYSNGVLQFIFVLALMFLSAGMMKIVGMEGILGAFMAGLVLNRLIPTVSPLMHNLEFVGNALFIPYFLIGVGMLIDLRVFFKGIDALEVTVVMTVMAIATKWLTAWATQKLCRMTKAERSLMYGLSTSRAAATLAVVLVGYGIILPDGSRLLGDEILNSAIALILITCIVSSFVTDRASRRMALSEMEKTESTDVDEEEKILISVSNPATVSSLVNLSLLIRDGKQRDNLTAVHVVSDNSAAGKASRLGKRYLEQAAQIASGAMVQLKTVSRYSANVATGVIHTVKEQEANTLVVGLHWKQTAADTFLGNVALSLLHDVHREVMVVKMIMPFNTIRRIVVAVPPKAQFEPGFAKWMRHIVRLGQSLNCQTYFHATPDTLKFIERLLRMRQGSVPDIVKLNAMDSWDDLLMLSAEVNYDHLAVVVGSRPGSVSYQPSFEQLPELAGRYFANCSLMILYPDQYGEPVQLPAFADPLSDTVKPLPLIARLRGVVGKGR